MQKIYRLTQRSSFTYIYKKGSVCSTPRLTMYYVPAHNLKVGIVVGKKVGNSVVRSRVKRRIGERFRLLIPFVRQDRNFVFIAKPESCDCTSGEFERDIIFLLKKTGSYVEENEISL